MVTGLGLEVVAGERGGNLKNKDQHRKAGNEKDESLVLQLIRIDLDETLKEKNPIPEMKLKEKDHLLEET